MKASGILLERATKADRHRQEQGVEASIVEALPDIASGREDDTRFVSRNVDHRLVDRPTLLSPHTSLQREDIRDLPVELLLVWTIGECNWRRSNTR